MNINFLDYVDVITVLAALLVGFVVKKWINDVDNKWIPTIVFLVGVGIAFGTHGFSVENFVTGGISGLASTGLHQLFKQFIDNKEE